MSFLVSKKIVNLDHAECKLIKNIAVEWKGEDEVYCNRKHLTLKSKALEATHADS